jgi:transcriptional regulator with XRE-family HTH domain
MDRGNLGKRVRALRTDRDLSQEALAREAGVSLNLVNKLERGVVTDPHYSTLRGISHALGVSIDKLLQEEPVPLDEALQVPGPTEAERQRPSLDQVREVFAPLADGLNRYCARWEEKLPNLQGTPEEVADFVSDFVDFRAFIMRALEEELYAIPLALDLGNRYAGESGLPRDMAVDNIRAQAAEHSLMQEALDRYLAVGQALAESIENEEAAESMRQVLAQVGV